MCSHHKQNCTLRRCPGFQLRCHGAHFRRGYRLQLRRDSDGSGALCVEGIIHYCDLITVSIFEMCFGFLEICSDFEFSFLKKMKITKKQKKHFCFQKLSQFQAKTLLNQKSISKRSRTVCCSVTGCWEKRRI